MTKTAFTNKFSIDNHIDDHVDKEIQECFSKGNSTAGTARKQTIPPIFDRRAISFSTTRAANTNTQPSNCQPAFSP